MATVHRKATPFADFTAVDLMQGSVITVARRTPITEVQRLLVEHRISGVPVTDEAGEVVGVVSMRDLVERYANDLPGRPSASFYDAPTWDPDDEYGTSRALESSTEDVASDLMSGNVYAVEKETPVREIAGFMLRHEIHRVMVRDRGRLIGIVSTTDIVRAVAAG